MKMGESGWKKMFDLESLSLEISHEGNFHGLYHWQSHC